MGVYQTLYILDYKQYSEEALPAYIAYRDQRNLEPLITLLRRISSNVSSYKAIKGFWVDNRRREYQNDIDILLRSNSKTTSPNDPEDIDGFIKDSVASVIVGVPCIPRKLKFSPILVIGNSPLFGYVEDKDSLALPSISPPPGVVINSPPRLMKYIAEGGSGEVLELCAFGDGYEKTYTNDELVKMHDELSKINPREDESQLQKDYDNLMSMLEFCIHNTNYKLVWVLE